METRHRRIRRFVVALVALVATGGCSSLPSGPGSNSVRQPNFVHVAPPRQAQPAGAVPQNSIASKFNGTAIAAGSQLWISAVGKYSGPTTAPVTFHLAGAMVTFTANGVAYAIPVPNATLLFSPTASAASTLYDPVSNTWLTIAPFGTSGNVFLTGLVWKVPVNLPGGIQPVSFSAVFTTDTPGPSINWQWSAAVYRNLSPAADSLNVKPLDDTHYTAWANSDHAGTPESFKSWVAGGATGGGGSNYTGNLSPSFVVVPVASSTGPLNGYAQISGDKGGTLTVGRFTLQVPAHAFSGTATVGIQVPDQAVLQCNLSISPAGANAFAVPVTLTSDYSGGNVVDPNTLVEVWFDGSAGLWRQVPGSSVDTTQQVVHAPLSHFSSYGVASKAGW